MTAQPIDARNLPVTDQLGVYDGYILPAPVEALTVLEHSVAADWTEFLDARLGYREDNGFVGRLPLLTAEIWETTPFNPHTVYLLKPEHVSLFVEFASSREGLARKVSDTHMMREDFRLVNAFENGGLVTYACLCFTVEPN